ncbi:MAG: hypothetical protein GY805_02960, partial [Chloroflexi bacterium]|nr:hypothetical protein [Chloroflexota bacterium]
MKVEKTNAKIAYDASLKLGSRLSVAGLLGLGVAVGVVVGFYAADQGVRWLPTMVEIFLGVCLVSLVTIIVGRAVKKETVKVTEHGVRVRWRIIVCLTLAIIVLVGQLAVYKMRESCMLTDLSAEDFNEAFATDYELYRQYDRGFENLLEALENRLEMFDADNPRVLTGDEEVFLRDVWVAIYDYAFEMDRIRLFYEDWYRFDPSRAQRKFHLRSFMLTYAAELSLYEKSSRLVKLVSANTNAEKFLNTPGPGEVPGAESFSQ